MSTSNDRPQSASRSILLGKCKLHSIRAAKSFILEGFVLLHDSIEYLTGSKGGLTSHGILLDRIFSALPCELGGSGGLDCSFCDLTVEAHYLDAALDLLRSINEASIILYRLVEATRCTPELRAKSRAISPL